VPDWEAAGHGRYLGRTPRNLESCCRWRNASARRRSEP
jgi:hypothetical protein